LKKAHFQMAYCSHWGRLREPSVVEEERIHLLPRTEAGRKFVLADSTLAKFRRNRLTRLHPGYVVVSQEERMLAYRLPPWYTTRDGRELVRELEAQVNEFAG